MTENRRPILLVHWVRCVGSLAISNAIVGAVLGAMYGKYSFGLAQSFENGSLVWTSLLGSLFGIVVPTAISAILLMPKANRSSAWPAWISLGPAATSMLSFVFVWQVPTVFLFIAVAAVLGSVAGIGAVKLGGGIESPRSYDDATS